jgi:periplasmic protein TonB
MRQTSRSVTLIAVIATHAVMTALVLRGPAVARVANPGIALQVSILQSPHPDSEPPLREFTPVLQPHQIVVPAPEIAISVSAEPDIVLAAPEQQAAPAVAAASEVPRQISAADYLRAPQPRYPALARQQRQQGLVLLGVLIDAKGLPGSIEIARSSGFVLLDRAACEAVRNALFRPYLEAGVARPVQVMIPIEFSLTERLASR